MATPNPGHARPFLGFHPLEQPLQTIICLGVPVTCPLEYPDQCLRDLIVGQLLVFHVATNPLDSGIVAGFNKLVNHRAELAVRGIMG